MDDRGNNETICGDFIRGKLFSVNSIVEYPGAALGRLTSINSELNGAI